MAASGIRILSEEDIERFHTEGFLYVPHLLEERDMVQIEAAFERMFEKVKLVASDPQNADEIAALALTSPSAPIVVQPTEVGSRYTYQARGEWTAETKPSMTSLSVRHVAWVGKEEPVLQQYGCDDRVTSVAVQLLGVGALAAGGFKSFPMIINQAHFKEPGDGVSFPWHQDSMHRRMAFGDFQDVNGKGSYVQVIVAVEDTTANAGPVCFIPRSNQLGHVNGQAGLDPAVHVTPEMEASKVTPLLKRGDAVCLNPYVIHGSQPNESTSWRCTFINGFAFPGAQTAQSSARYHWEEVPLPPLPTAEAASA